MTDSRIEVLKLYAKYPELVLATPLLSEALKCYDIRETPGDEDNPVIISWARSLGDDAWWFVHDSQAWCALGVAYCAKQAGYILPFEPAKSLSWARFEDEVPFQPNITQPDD